jgi:hypothetical protein
MYLAVRIASEVGISTGPRDNMPVEVSVAQGATEKSQFSPYFSANAVFAV